MPQRHQSRPEPDHGPHPEPSDEEAVVETPPSDPHFEALGEEHKAEAVKMAETVQRVQDAYDHNIVTALGGGVYQLGALLISMYTRLLHVEQKLEELESKHRRHVHTDDGREA